MFTRQGKTGLSALAIAHGHGLAAFDDQGRAEHFTPDSDDSLGGPGALMPVQKAAQDDGFAAGADFGAFLPPLTGDVFDHLGTLHQKIMDLIIDCIQFSAQFGQARGGRRKIIHCRA
ncbi:hypothetical protein Aam_039_026 [Acidocella aminolytica 101 = DSM 11237]|uniref:Uncharacterized protein n=1 Tax=Acidocella aminolytica 101 = DSM 11237 TaxID=1120923 RepID=A0A0D6PH52_9PROT|nr:hypothetical protein Aam_039_026 [Acidocella aminolytica 101 = DSM 11237]